MNDISDIKIGIVITLLFIYLDMFLTGMYLFKLNNKVIRMERTVKELRQEVKESEERCKRMTDTCIDVLANKRWE